MEAALVFPLFVFAMTAFLYLFFLVQLQAQVGRAMADAGRSLAQEAYLTQDVGSVAGSALALAQGKKETMAYLEDSAAAGLIRGGLSGISFLGTTWDADSATLTLRATYRAVLPPGLSWFSPVKVTQKRVIRGFVGFSGRSGSGQLSGEEVVYVTDYGTVYHRDLSCRYLKLSIRQEEFSEVASLRNADGAKYYPCERCWEEGAEVVYLTEDGTRYHQSMNCSSLVRGIHTRLLSETGGLPPCSACGGG